MKFIRAIDLKKPALLKRRWDTVRRIVAYALLVLLMFTGANLHVFEAVVAWAHVSLAAFSSLFLDDTIQHLLLPQPEGSESFLPLIRLRHWMNRIDAAVLCWPLLFVAVAVVYYIAAGRKKCVIYLRRFGLRESTQVVHNALRLRLRRRYRVITLDDNSFRPKGLPIAERLVGLGIAPIAGLLILFFSFVAVRTEYFNQRFNPSFGGRAWAPISGESLFDVLYFGPAIVWVLLTVVVCFITHLLRISIRSSMEIKDRNDIKKVEEYILSLKSWFHAPALMAPHAMVVRVMDTLWKPAVLRLSKSSGVILVDISEPTKCLNWEIEKVLETRLGRVAFIGEEGLIKKWRAANQPIEPGTYAKTAELLEGAEVLIYTAHSDSSFADSLSKLLDNLSSERDIRRRISWSMRRIGRGLASLLLYSFLGVLTAGVVIYSVLQIRPLLREYMEYAYDAVSIDIRDVHRFLRQPRKAPTLDRRRVGERICNTEIDKEILDRVVRIVAGKLGVDEHEVTLTANFCNDLGADSIDIVELTMSLEESFDIEISDEKMDIFYRVCDVVTFISDLVGGDQDMAP